LLGLSRGTVWFTLQLAKRLEVWVAATTKSINGFFDFIVAPASGGNVQSATYNTIIHSLHQVALTFSEFFERGWWKHLQERYLTAFLLLCTSQTFFRIHQLA